MLGIIGMCLILIVSLFIVIKAADLFVDNIVEIGTALGVSQILLGVTAAAIGTSLPEFGSALIASLSGNAEMGVGVVIGSNIWNLAGILGITATVTGLIQADKKSINRDGLMAIITGIVLVVFMIYGFLSGNLEISGFASIVMIIVYIYYIRVLIKDQKKDIENLRSTKEAAAKEKESIEEKDENVPEFEEVTEKKKKPVKKKSVLFVIMGIIGLAVGCQLLIYSASSLATTFGIPAAIMGLFTLSVGTSIPELVVTLSSAMKGLHDISIGTIFGSATFNILMGIGVPAFIVSVPIETLSLYFDAPVMLGIYALTLVIMKHNGMKLNRLSGIFLIAFYVAYAFIRIFVLA